MTIAECPNGGKEHVNGSLRKRRSRTCVSTHDQSATNAACRAAIRQSHTYAQMGKTITTTHGITNTSIALWVRETHSRVSFASDSLNIQLARNSMGISNAKRRPTRRQ